MLKFQCKECLDLLNLQRDIGDLPGCLLRVHSECLTGDVLGSARCDCGNQLDLAMQLIWEGWWRSSSLPLRPRRQRHWTWSQTSCIQYTGLRTWHCRSKLGTWPSCCCPWVWNWCSGKPIRSAFLFVILQFAHLNLCVSSCDFKKCLLSYKNLE